jgi:hypothetical protein
VTPDLANTGITRHAGLCWAAARRASSAFPLRIRRRNQKARRARQDARRDGAGFQHLAIGLHLLHRLGNYLNLAAAQMLQRRGSSG